MDKIKVYRLDGSLQCDPAPGIDAAVMSAELEEAGIKVHQAYKKQAPIPTPTVCGAPTGMANVFEIPFRALAAVLALPGGFQPWLFDSARVEAYKLDGTVQCQPGGEIPLEATAAELTGAGVRVIASRKDRIGMVPALCGWPTGAINVVVIDADHYPKAQKLGFQLLSASPDGSACKPDSEPFRQFTRMRELGAAAQFNLTGFRPEFPPEPLPAFLPRPFPPLEPFPLPFPRPGPIPTFPRHPHVAISELPGHMCRVIRPGDMVTLDLRFERFNISLDANGVITNVGFY